MRKSGYYWIVYNDEYQVAKYDADTQEWYIIGIEKESHCITDEDVVVDEAVGVNLL